MIEERQPTSDKAEIISRIGQINNPSARARAARFFEYYGPSLSRSLGDPFRLYRRACAIIVSAEAVDSEPETVFKELRPIEIKSYIAGRMVGLQRIPRDYSRDGEPPGDFVTDAYNVQNKSTQLHFRNAVSELLLEWTREESQPFVEDDPRSQAEYLNGLMVLACNFQIDNGTQILEQIATDQRSECLTNYDGFTVQEEALWLLLLEFPGQQARVQVEDFWAQWEDDARCFYIAYGAVFMRDFAKGLVLLPTFLQKMMNAEHIEDAYRVGNAHRVIENCLVPTGLEDDDSESAVRQERIQRIRDSIEEIPEQAIKEFGREAMVNAW